MESKTAVPSHPGEETDSSPSQNFWADFHPDTLAVQQFFSARRTKTLAQPEQALMRAILQDALQSFQEHCGATSDERKQLFEDVEKWFFVRGSDWVFDFENICSALGFDADYLRQGLVQWRQKELIKHRRRPPGKSGKRRHRGCRFTDASSERLH